MTDEKRGRGRPTKEAPLVRRAMFLPAMVWARIDKFGLPWARNVLAKAPSPNKPPKSKKSDAKRALLAADEFYNAGLRCAALSAEPSNTWLPHPEVVNFAFAAELAMKGLHIHIGQQPWGHDLKSLFFELPEPLQHRISSGFRHQRFDERLSEAKNAFEKWRYAFQHDTLSVSLYFLTDLAKSTVRVLNEELGSKS